MQLHEEYIRRHRLAVPVVRADARSTVFLRSVTSPYDWKILIIRWMPCESHPGHYCIRVFSPVHNGYRTHMLTCSVDQMVFWDNYEPFVLDFVKSCRPEFSAVPSEESILAAWQMFLLIFDSKLVLMGQEFLTLVSRSIAPNLSIEERSTAVVAAKAQLRLLLPEVSEHLHHQIFPLADFYSDWLVRLIND